MLQMSDGSLKVHFDPRFCQQCGTCLSACPVSAISAILNKNGLNRISIDHEKCITCQKCVKACPANKDGSKEDRLFNCSRGKEYYLAYNSETEIRRNASSGGVARTLLVEGLSSGIIDGAYTLKESSSYPFCEGEFYHSEHIPQNKSIPNSVYHTVMVNRNLNKIGKTNRLMVIGTSCQLRGIEQILKGKFDGLIKVCIFCKQQKSFESTRFLAKIMGTTVSMDKPFTFNYRGNGWPGIVKINQSELEWDMAARIPFGRRLWTVPGCNICSNPFGDNVDITLLDPWKIEKENSLGKTLTIAHTKAGDEFLNSLQNLTLENKSYTEIEAALDLKDIVRKQQLVPYFRGENCSLRIQIAGRLERFQRWYLTSIVKILPRMPLAFYKVINKMPDIRNMILR